jgi:hypothetical protein
MRLCAAFCGVMLCAGSSWCQAAEHGAVVYKVLDQADAGENLLQDDNWRAWQAGFVRRDNVFFCDNGQDWEVQRGVSQAVTLNQVRPEPIVARAESKAEGVGGGRNSDYALYLDLTYMDGTPLWGQVDQFDVGSHDWETAQVMIFPEKPVRSVSFHMLFRRHTGRALFRGAELRVLEPPFGAMMFDGVPISPASGTPEGFCIRDVKAGSDFVGIEQAALGIELNHQTQGDRDGEFHDVTVANTTGEDRAVTLVYSCPVSGDECLWLEDPRHSVPAEENRDYVNSTSFRAGSNGRLSRYPFAAISAGTLGVGLGIDMDRPAFFRAGYNAGTRTLFLAYDIGLTPEKPKARVRFCRFEFDPAWGFRSALARYYNLFPQHFERRIARQGLWMPFAKISEVAGWEDFGFAFKEGTNETAWDDGNGIVTFRYTEPMTWWMSMPRDMPRTIEAAVNEARRLADEQGDIRARAFLSSAYHNDKGQFPARLLNTPWSDGAVWSINSMPGVPGEVTDFKNKWNQSLIDRLYGQQRSADLDGEYIDSSEGYVTDELNFRRDHFSGTDTALTFSLESQQVCIFRGLIAFEYIRGIEQDVHGMGKLMMANSTPIGLCWLAPLLDVMGTETDWNPGAQWRPMSDQELLYRRAMCKGKPYCFLMNTEFEQFPHALVEKYMKRSLAYGMFPGFFSHNASQGHYFTRPELYERDRDLFKTYVPLCRRVAEAGWEPVTSARSSDEQVYVERFGDRFLTVFNDSDELKSVTITVEGRTPGPSRDLVRDEPVVWEHRVTRLTIAAEDVAVIEMD